MIMELIKKLSEHIEDEIADMECYAKLAIEVKEEYPVLAKRIIRRFFMRRQKQL